jgi:hypothetical protein
VQPEKAEEALPGIKRKFSAEAFGEVVAAAPQFPAGLPLCRKGRSALNSFYDCPKKIDEKSL